MELKIVFFFHQDAFFTAYIAIMKKKNTPSEEIILNEVRLQGSSTINFALL